MAQVGCAKEQLPRTICQSPATSDGRPHLKFDRPSPDRPASVFDKRRTKLSACCRQRNNPNRPSLDLSLEASLLQPTKRPSHPPLLSLVIHRTCYLFAPEAYAQLVSIIHCFTEGWVVCSASRTFSHHGSQTPRLSLIQLPHHGLLLSSWLSCLVSCSSCADRVHPLQ